MSEITREEREKKIVELMRRVEKTILTPESNFENVDLKEIDSMYSDMRDLGRRLRRYMNTLENIRDFKDLWDCIKNKGDYLTVFKKYIAKIHGETFSHDDIPF